MFSHRFSGVAFTALTSRQSPGIFTTYIDIISNCGKDLYNKIEVRQIAMSKKSTGVNRRSYLRRVAATGAVSSVALATGGTATASSKGERRQVGERYGTSTGTELTVAGISIKHALVHLAQADHPMTVSKRGKQYVFAHLDIEADENYPRAERFRLIVDGTGYEPVERILSVPVREVADWYREMFKAYTSDTTDQTEYELGRGVVAFEVPVGVSGEEARIQWSNDEESCYWSLNESHQRRLRQTPDVQIESFDMPDEAVHGEPFTAKVTATNRSDVHGDLAAVLGPDRGVHPTGMTLRVPAGGRQTRECTFQYPSARPGNDRGAESENGKTRLQFKLQPASGQTRTQTITITEAES